MDDMLKISAVFMTTVAFAALLASDPAATANAGFVADATFVRVKTFAIHPSVVPSQVASFEPSVKFQIRPNLRRASSRVAALD